MKKISRFLTIFVLLNSISFHLHAQWSSDPTVNTPVSDAIKDQREPCIISDGNGGAIISWRDYRNTTSIFGGDIFAQRLNSGGDPEWAADGMAVNDYTYNKGHFRPLMTEDGRGNGIIVWGRNPYSFYNYDLFAQKVDTEGVRVWSPGDVTISDASGTETFHKVVSDDSCGAIITYMHLPGAPGSTNILAQRVDSTGAIRWENDGVEICMAAESQMDPDLVGDGNGGAIIVWGDSRAGIGESDVYAQKVNSAGEIQWTTDGVEVSHYTGFQGVPKIVSDGAGGAIIVWEDTRSGNYDLYMQHLNSDGEPQWTSHGNPLCTATGDQQNIDIVSDGTGGAIVVWQDLRNGNLDIYAQRINASGLVQWDANGLAISSVSNAQYQPTAISDHAGGIIITWTDYRSDASGDIYAQRLSAVGIGLWTDNGTAICTASGIQEAPCLVSDGNMGALIAWSDKRDGPAYDIYAQNIDKNGKLGMIIDDDDDGISDFEESGPDGNNPDYDGNSDGTADRSQGNVASFKTYDNSQYVTLAVPDPAILENVMAIDNPAPDEPGAPVVGSYPYGFFSFSISGLTAGSQLTATMNLHNGPTVNKYYKYGPRPAQAEGWYEFNYDNETGAEINGNTILLHFTDGVRGDSDLQGNGIIVDPGGPEYLATSIEDQNIIDFGLEVNFPNPFYNSTTIPFNTPGETEIIINVFDMSGRFISCLFKGWVGEGRHITSWNADRYKDGVYIIEMSDGKRSVTQKVVKLGRK